MHRVGYRTVKGPVSENKSKKGLNFFVTKATDLKEEVGSKN